MDFRDFQDWVQDLLRFATHFPRNFPRNFPRSFFQELAGNMPLTESHLDGQLLTRLRPKKEDREGKIKIHGAHFNQRLPTEIEIISDRTTKSTTYLVE
jgi:hypothetical protein